jgi:hypothetical protein
MNDGVLRLKAFDLQECKICFSAPLHGPDGRVSRPNSSLSWLLSFGFLIHDELNSGNFSPVDPTTVAFLFWYFLPAPEFLNEETRHGGLRATSHAGSLHTLDKSLKAVMSSGGACYCLLRRRRGIFSASVMLSPVRGRRQTIRHTTIILAVFYHITFYIILSNPFAMLQLCSPLDASGSPSRKS